MWTLLSFTGRFDVDFFESLPGRGDPSSILRMSHEATEEQKTRTRAALEARAEVRLGLKYQRQQEKYEWEQEAQRQGKRLHVETPPLTRAQDLVLCAYLDGSLQEKANELTKESGHGRLKRQDGSYVDIGGSTGGFVRYVLDDWRPPDVSDFSYWEDWRTTPGT